MKIGNINKSLTLVANLGVIIGLIALIFEINQNTTAIESEVAWARAVFGQQQNITAMEHAEDLLNFVEIPEDELLSLINSNSSNEAFFKAQAYTLSTRVYQETRFLTRTTPAQRAEQRSQLLRDLGNYHNRLLLLESFGYDDLDEEFGTFLEDIINEAKRQ